MCPDAQTTDPCEGCFQVRLDRLLEHGRGELVRNILDLDFALQAGVNVSFDEISYFEFMLLRILTDERNKYQEEQMKKVSQNAK